jgi:GNAT superfamily N-acetyltransferase
MQFISPDEISNHLRSLFTAEMPVGLRCLAILNGAAAGRILANDPIRPSYALVQELADGTVFLGGSFTPATLAQGIRLLRQERDVVIGLWPDDPRLPLLPPDPDYEGVAIDFTDRPLDDDLSRFRQVPAGCRLQPVDHALFRRLAGFAWYIAMFGSAEKALAKVLGYCLMQDGAILCEALAGPDASNPIEIGVHTDELHQGQGYATLTCAHLIHACEAKGYRTLWNAAQQNGPSIALARKLGYRRGQAFHVLAWST